MPRRADAACRGISLPIMTLSFTIPSSTVLPFIILSFMVLSFMVLS